MSIDLLNSVVVYRCPTYSINCVSNQFEIKQVKDIIKNWEDLMSDRLAVSRSKKESANTKEFDDFCADQKTFSDYKKVLSYAKNAIGNLSKEMQKSFSMRENRIFIYKDNEDRVQGIAGATKAHNHVYLHALVSAPWNISMHAPCPEEIKAIKGVGRALVLQTYLWTQNENKPQLRTTPLGSAASFYRTIGMPFDDEEMMFY